MYMYMLYIAIVYCMYVHICTICVYMRAVYVVVCGITMYYVVLCTISTMHHV